MKTKTLDQKYNAARRALMDLRDDNSVFPGDKARSLCTLKDEIEDMIAVLTLEE